MTALGTVNTAENNTVYFISDGVPTSGVLVDPAGSTGYRNFVNTNGVKSYALGIASDISNPAELNNIHNVDADVSGTKDAAIIVTDVGRLDEVLAEELEVLLDEGSGHQGPGVVTRWVARRR